MIAPNPVVRKLGLSDDDRVVILHADDISSFQCTVTAYADLMQAGLISSAATMVPCPWFPAVAAYCREHAGDPNLDMGVHLTLTSEWQAYRWHPLTTGDSATGLLDEEGYFHGRSEPVQDGADPTAVAQELRAQIERAYAAGIDVTHLDSHMFTVFHSRFVQVYFDLAWEFDLPAFFVRRQPDDRAHFGGIRERITGFDALVGHLEERGMPLFDQAMMMPLDQPDDRAGQFKRKIDALPAGLTYLICHPAQDTPELREAVPERDWPNRVADYRTFCDGGLRDYISAAGVHVIGYRVLRDLLRARPGSS